MTLWPWVGSIFVTFRGISVHWAVLAAEPVVGRAALYQLPRRRRTSLASQGQLWREERLTAADCKFPYLPGSVLVD